MQSVVCHLIDSNLGSNYFRSIARYHNRDRFPVVIGSVEPAGRLQEMMRELGTPTFSLDATRRLQYPLVIWRLARFLKREGVSILHAHCFDPTFIGLFAARLAGVSFVFTRHHSDHNIRLGKRWHTTIDAWCARLSDHVIAVSEITRQIMIEVESVPHNLITVVHNGMEPLPKPKPERIARVKEELGLGARHVCLMLARLHEEKGHRFLFDAVPGIVSAVGPTDFLLAGEGPHREQLEAEVIRRGLHDFVRFLGRRGDVAELISLSDVVVLPSLAESFGFTLLEAMSLGKPVVGSTAGGIPEVVANGETGLLVRPGDRDALAGAICSLLGDPERSRVMGERGARRASLFGFERMIDGYQSVYDRINKVSRPVDHFEKDIATSNAIVP
ncbi:MAG TPA: glycosyltransferase family 4 protein [Blastocatellia bacterium]|nr:glycosyltransferase family 4 protein [Blastocatellia bacterium]